MNTSKTAIGSWYELKNGNKLLLLANGFPVNFFCAESVPDKLMDLILTLMFQAAKLLTKAQLPPKIYRWTDEDKRNGVFIDEDDIAKRYHDFHFI